MVLDIDEFRPEKGGNPDKIRENQKKRYCDVSMVDKIVEADEKWRKGELFYDLITYPFYLDFLKYFVILILYSKENHRHLIFLNRFL